MRLLWNCRSRWWLLPSASTVSGLEAPSWRPCPPSSRCGLPRASTTSPAPPSCTASASKRPAVSRVRAAAAAAASCSAQSRRCPDQEMSARGQSLVSVLEGRKAQSGDSGNIIIAAGTAWGPCKCRGATSWDALVMACACMRHAEF